MDFLSSFTYLIFLLINCYSKLHRNGGLLINNLCQFKLYKQRNFKKMNLKFNSEILLYFLLLLFTII